MLEASKQIFLRPTISFVHKCIEKIEKLRNEISLKDKKIIELEKSLKTKGNEFSKLKGSFASMEKENAALKTQLQAAKMKAKQEGAKKRKDTANGAEPTPKASSGKRSKTAQAKDALVVQTLQQLEESPIEGMPKHLQAVTSVGNAGVQMQQLSPFTSMNMGSPLPLQQNHMNPAANMMMPIPQLMMSPYGLSNQQHMVQQLALQQLHQQLSIASQSFSPLPYLSSLTQSQQAQSLQIPSATTMSTPFSSFMQHP